mmetsp:Transcript_6057/g.15169  ORF Transcript_6057/g.15169 Transcript_6057/m.15169 type:complete len:278 (-) Transcript_6057:199-1032(-)
MHIKTISGCDRVKLRTTFFKLGMLVRIFLVRGVCPLLLQRTLTVPFFGLSRNLLLGRDQSELLHALPAPLALLVHPKDDIEPANTLVHLHHQPHDKSLPNKLLGNDQIHLVDFLAEWFSHQLVHHIILLGVRQLGPFHDRHVRPFRPVGAFPRRRLEVEEHAERAIHRMPEEGQEPSLVLLVVQLLAGEVRLHREDEIGRVALDQSQLLGADDPGLDGRVDVDDLPVLVAVRLEDDDVGFLVVAEFWVGADAVGERLAHALVQTLGGGSAALGNMPK